MTPAELIAAQQQAMATLRERVQALVAARWAALGGRYDDNALEQWIQAVTPVALAGQRQAALLTDAYLARLTTETLGGRARPVGVSADETTGAALRNGVPVSTVYARPVVTVRTALAEGRPIDRALAKGAQRAASIAETDMRLAQRAAMVRVMAADSRIVGYRRTLTGQSCGLCVMASTQRYHRGDLMPIHGRCDCGVAAIYGTADPGRVLNGKPVDRVKQLLGNWDEQRFGPKPKDSRGAMAALRFDVHEHGELGPVLTRHGQHFTGPDDLAA